jgi:STAS-like domain of unknown function (DUF4325)
MINQGIVTRISIANDFSRVPAGRYKADGPFSGERFREELLLPMLRKGGRLEVELDGVEGYGSSFLEEAFGGLIRSGGYTAGELHERLSIRTEDQAWFQEVWSYIDRCATNEKT